MKPNEAGNRREATISLIRRLTERKLTQSKYKTAQDRRLNNFYEQKEKENTKNGRHN